MVLAIDVHYKDTYAKVVGVLFQWEDSVPVEVITTTINTVDDYIPGEFYKRELPCILKLLEQVTLKELEAIIVDGHVYVDNENSYGLGGYLYEALDEKIPVIGVAKNRFTKANKTYTEVYRGTSMKPLCVSTINYEQEKAIKLIENMNGVYRMPTLLQLMDSITKEK